MPRSDETVQHPKKAKKSKLASIVSGAAAGVVVSACVQPLDVLRTRMQADVAKGVFLSTARTLQTVVAEGGFKSLWRGTQATVLRLGFGAGLHFFFLESLKPLLERTQPDGRKKLTVAGAAVAGGVARGLAAVVACPFTVVKTQMEYTGAGAVQYRSTAHALGTIMRERGVRGLFSGVGPTLLSNAPFSALYYVFYTQLQERLQNRQWPSFGVNLASGTVAAVAATLITQPADVVRTRIQLGIGVPTVAATAAAAAAAAGGPAAAAARASSMQILWQIMAEQGTRGLLAGALPRVVKRTFQTALVWAIYEELFPKLSDVAAWAGEQIELKKRRAEASGSSGSSSSSDTEGDVRRATRW